MKKVILYIRVSTDEQAEKGYSLNDQEERLIRHSERNQWEVVKIFKEDHSAKTLRRPVLTEMRSFAKKHRKEIDIIGFVKWDRLSRSTRDSYTLIDEFKELGMESCAIEQPLDLDVPESKIMLAIYVTTPEVENDRRSMNVTRGMRKAQKTGRWVNNAPLGYKNSRDDNNKPVIIPDHNATFIKSAFEELLNENARIEEVRRKLNKTGMKCSRSNFNRLVRNPVYMGKIRIPAYKDEPEDLVEGIHEPIISPDLYWSVQEIIDGNRPKNLSKLKTHDQFPLRGFLQCAQCGKMLTASRSRGKKGVLYTYYHCSKGCSERHSADQVNGQIVELFKKISANKGAIDFYTQILKDLYRSSYTYWKQKQGSIQDEIDKNQKRIHEAMNNQTDRLITVNEYREIKRHYEEQNAKLSSQKIKIGSNDNYVSYVNRCADYLKRLDSLYIRLKTPFKRKMLGSIFKEKLVYEKGGFRTPVLQESVLYMTLNNNELEQIKKGLYQENLIQSREVVLTGIEPVLPE